MLAPGVEDRARANGGPVALSRPQAGESARVAEPRLRPRAVDSAKLQMAAFGLALALVELTLLLSVPQGGLAWLVSLFPVVGLVYLGTGVVASLSRPSNAMGTILAAGGLTWIVAGFVNAGVPALIGAGLVVATVPLAIVVHLLHAFPSGKLRGRLSLWTVLAGYGACLLLQAPQWLFGEGPGGPFTVLELANRPDLARWGQWMQWAVGSCVMVATAAVLLRRLRGMTLAQRRVSAPLFAYGIFAVLFVPVSGQLAIVFPQARIGVITAQLGVLLLVPLAFVVVMLRGGFARTGALQELGAWLGQDHEANRGLREALAQALGDDSLELFYWVPATGAFVDGSGRKVALPMLGSERGVVEVSLGDRPVGAIAYDATLIADAAEVRAAGRVVALALESERLTAELRASRERLKRSRARIVRATDAERRRIARDLHDGLQARLVLAAMGADRLRSDETLAPDLRASATKVQAELQASIEELRELVHGVMPAALTERGLFAAIRELVGGLPVPATLEVEQNGDRLPAAVESAGYFVVTEALANALKHSGARQVAVRAGVVRGALRVEVSDDGVGGARFEGAGLQGMADRVEALDGHLSIESPSGAGTRVVATVPCGS